MATFRKTEDELVSCPYNKAHCVRRSRLQAHMVKCREHSLEGKKICPFNATHCIPESEFQQHLGICADKDVIDKKVFEATKGNSTFKGRTAVPSYSAFKISQNEDWDEDSSDGYRCKMVDTEHENSVKAKSSLTQLCFKVQAEDSSSESSNHFEKKKGCPFQHDVSNNWKAKTVIGMGRGQVILERLWESENQKRTKQSKHQNHISIGRGRGLLSISNGFNSVEEYHSGNAEKEDSVNAKSMKYHNESQADNSYDSVSSSSSSEDSRNCEFQSLKISNGQKLTNCIGMGRGQEILERLSQPKHQSEIQPAVCQNNLPIGRARGFISSSRGRKLFVNNSRIVVENEYLRKVNILNNDESIQKFKYNIDHLPPCRPGEIRSVPLFYE